MKKLSRDEMKKVSGGDDPCLRACINQRNICIIPCGTSNPSNSCVQACNVEYQACRAECV